MHRERSFGLTMATVCGLLAGYWFWRGHVAVANILSLVALGFLVPALLRPTFLRRPSSAWMKVAQGLGWVNTRVLLSAFFLLVITPAGLIARLARWDPLRMRCSRGSGWVPYPARIRDPKHYERMY